jgi:hypothetical protein
VYKDEFVHQQQISSPKKDESVPDAILDDYNCACCLRATFWDVGLHKL